MTLLSALKSGVGMEGIDMFPNGLTLLIALMAEVMAELAPLILSSIAEPMPEATSETAALN